jgi:hypothetical protein
MSVLWVGGATRVRLPGLAEKVKPPLSKSSRCIGAAIRLAPHVHVLSDTFFFIGSFYVCGRTTTLHHYGIGFGRYSQQSCIGQRFVHYDSHASEGGAKDQRRITSS